MKVLIRKKIKWGDGHIGGGCLQGVQNLLLTDIERLKGGSWSPELLGALNCEGRGGGSGGWLI